MVVRKKDGSALVCIDYRRLSRVVVFRDKFPLIAVDRLIGEFV